MKTPIDLEKGKVYKVKHTSGTIQARFIEEHKYQHAHMRTRTRYRFINLSSGKEIVLKSQAKVLGLVVAIPK